MSEYDSSFICICYNIIVFFFLNDIEDCCAVFSYFITIGFNFQFNNNWILF